jgi:hypothetical protein
MTLSQVEALSEKFCDGAGIGLYLYVSTQNDLGTAAGLTRF